MRVIQLVNEANGHEFTFNQTDDTFRCIRCGTVDRPGVAACQGDADDPVVDQWPPREDGPPPHAAYGVLPHAEDCPYCT